MHAHRSQASKLRVVTLVEGIGLSGGAERLAREILTRLDPERFERTLCLSRWPPRNTSAENAEHVVEQVRSAGVRFIGLERRSRRDAAAWWPLLSLLRNDGVDVLHAHKFGSNVWAALLGSVARTPVVLAHEHTWSFEGQPLRRALDRHLIAPRVDAFLTVSRADRRRMIEVERIDPDKLVYVPNGISAGQQGDGRKVRRELGIDESAPVIGTVCVLRRQKALDVLIEAVPALRHRFPDLRVLIVGDGLERGRLERLIAELRLERTVTLLGRRSDVPDLLDALDVAVSSSDFEGMPLSVLEYMEAGLPVVGTRVGGVPDVIEEGVGGLLVERQSPEELAHAVAAVLGDPGRAAAFGRHNRERRRAEFDIERTVDRIGQIYEQLLTAHRDGRLRSSRLGRRRADGHPIAQLQAAPVRAQAAATPPSRTPR